MANTLFAMVASLGVDPSPEPGEERSLEAWFLRAQKRPAFELWGKAHPTPLGWPAHPLLCHMLDVAAVAAVLLTQILPPRLVQRLLSIHPEPDTALRLLLLIVALHDLGKATPAFQSKVTDVMARLRASGMDAAPEPGDLHHGDIGLLPLSVALQDLGFPQTQAIALARAVTGHHGQFPTNATGLPPRGHSRRQLGQNPRWEQARQQILQELTALFGGGEALAAARTDPPQDHGRTMLLAGLTSVADWVGSMDTVFTYEAPPSCLPSYWTVALSRAQLALESAGIRPIQRPPHRTFAELFPGYTPWPLHLAAEQVANRLAGPSLVVVEAPMGEGKTEASLLLGSAAEARADALGLYMGLPTQATANQMLGRIQAFLARARPREKVNLLLAHGEAALVERFQQLRLAAIYDRSGGTAGRSAPEGSVRAEGWFLSKKRVLLADHAVGTIDQTLLSVMLVPHGFVRLFGLAGKTVILDEIHAYDTYTGTLLEELLGWLAALGASVVLLSATLPRSKKEALVLAFQRGLGLPAAPPPLAPYPRLTFTSNAGTDALHFSPRGRPVAPSLEWMGPDVEQVVLRALESSEPGGCVGIIFNTVARAQQAHDFLRKTRPDLEHRLLLHARLLPEERNRREQLLERWLGPERRTSERPERAIILGTQVLEQSLDVDFDVLFTDLAPVDLLLQRAGRLFRHDRGNRHAARSQPRLVVLCPEGDTRQDLDELAVMYPEILLRHTLDALLDRTTIRLPEEIEPLVEQVYQQASRSPPEDPYQAAFIKHQGIRVQQELLARQKVLQSPVHEDDIFGALQVFLDEDDDPLLHQQLRAATRLGDPSVELICIERLPTGQLSLGDGLPFDLDTEPDPQTTLRLVRRSIGVSRFSIVRALCTREHEAWKKSAILRHRRPVIFENGRATVGGTPLLLDPELGLVFNPSTPSPS